MKHKAPKHIYALGIFIYGLTTKLHYPQMQLLPPPCLEVIHRSVMPRPAGQLIRLHIGLEHVDDLCNDLSAGFAAL